MEISDYFKGLTEEDKVGYSGKLTLSTGSVLPDPYILKDWSNDVTFLPDISWGDIYTYLIDHPDQFSKESLKAYKSLEAYNFFISGHVQDVFHHKVDNKSKFCFIKSEVLPSQRQSVKAKLYKVWVCIHKEETWVLTANCTCMSGLGSACSHAAALLFKLQACAVLELNKIASTSKLCSWKKSRKNAVPAALSNISFKKLKQNDVLPDVPENQENLPPFCSPDPTKTSSPFIKQKLLELHKLKPNAAVFTSTCLINNQTYDSEETDSADENEINCIPEPLSSLFDPKAINFDSKELINFSGDLFEKYSRSYTNTHFENLFHRTRQQNLSSDWKIHRIGRITASISKMAYKTKLESPSKTIIDTIMQYKSFTGVAATRYGQDNEPIAFREFTKMLAKEHKNVKVINNGLHIGSNYQFLGASPDGIVSCTCHGRSLLEIKCPYKYRNGLDGWQSDAEFPISPDGSIKIDHPYHYQIQHQMLVTGIETLYFYIWTNCPEKNNYLLKRVEKDNEFCNKLINKY